MATSEKGEYISTAPTPTIESNAPNSDAPNDEMDKESDVRDDLEKAILPFIDNFMRELIKMKLVSRPKGGTKKEQKVKDVIDLCMQEDQDELLNVICNLIKDVKLPQLADDLLVYARPPPVVEEPEEEVMDVEENQEPEEVPTEEIQVEEVPKGKPYTEVIESSTGTFIDCLVIDQILLDFLENNAVINEDMRNKISCRPNRHDKVRVFLNFMKTLGPQSLHALIDALRLTNQVYLANILNADIFT